MSRYLVFTLALVLPLVTLAELQITRLTPENLDRLPRGGPAAVAGIGDWWLSNGSLCAVVSDLGHDAGIVAGGGSLVDIGHCESGNDQWLNNNIIAGLSKDDALQAQSIRIDEENTALEVLSEGRGIRQTARYRLDSGRDRLHLEVAFQRIAEGPAITMNAMITLHPEFSLQVFDLPGAHGDSAGGPVAADVDNNSILSLINAMQDADTTVLLGNDLESAPISYRLQLAAATLRTGDGEEREVPRFQLSTGDYTLQGWMSRPPWLGSGRAGLLSFAQSPFMDIGLGETLTAHFVIDVAAADTVDAFTVADTARQLSGNTLPGTAVTLFHDDGRALNHTIAGPDGSYALAIGTAKALDVLLATPDGRTARHQLSAGAEGAVLDQPFSAPARLSLPRGKVGRITVLGIDGTANPLLREQGRMQSWLGTPAADGLQENNLALAGLASDPRWLVLPEGNYRVLISRGPEYSVTDNRVSVSAGESGSFDLPWPTRQVNTPNTVTADLHVHSSVSFDSPVPRATQLRRYAASGGEVLVFSEHNRISDLPDHADWPLLMINGVEYTGTARTPEAPTTIGHSNAFPVTADARRHRGGMPRVEASRLRDVIRRTRQRWPDALFQLNHPRSPHPNDADLAFFSHLSNGTGLDTLQRLTEGNNRSLLETGPDGIRDIDFDLMEIINGPRVDVYRQVQQDWFWLLRQGYRRAGSANADSHNWEEPLGLPVNYVFTGNATTPAEKDIINSLRRGHFYGSSGPYLEVTLTDGDAGTARPGDLLTTASANLSIRLQTADWIGAETLRIYVDGDIVTEKTIDGSGEWQFPLTFDDDGFVIVEAQGSAGEIYRILHPKFTPLAFSNPIYIDADGDGEWNPTP